MPPTLRALGLALVALALAACSAGGGNPVPYALQGDPPSNYTPPPAASPPDDRSTPTASTNTPPPTPSSAPTPAPTSAPAWDGTPYYDANAKACVTTLGAAENPCEQRYDAMTATPHGKLGPSETTGYGQCGVYYTWYDYTTDDVRRCFYSTSVKLLVGWQRWTATPSYCGPSQLLQAGEVPDGCGPPQTPVLP